MLLALIGMRPGEVCGLRWAEDVDLDRETLTISNVRTLVWTEQGAQVVEKDPKTDAGKRTLPLPAPVVDSPRRFKATQAAERLAAGETYEASGYVLVDELGRPSKTDQLRRAAYHADLSMAQRVYVHPSPKDLEQGRDALAALLSPGKREIL